jgi:DNA/RNA endonuclease YhcR with UshA esterase domain
MSHCPSCGRYVGPYHACPYCGARLTGRISIRVVKIVAILLATVGLVALWFAATRAGVPLIQIQAAGATMNMAYVRLQGRCTRAPSYDPRGETLGFWIEDDTGEMYVSAYRAQTRQILAEGRVPAPGDRVEVAGTLRIREDFLSLTVNVPAQLKVTRAEPVERAIGTLGPADQYVRVRVRGQVRDVYEPYEGLTLITIRDATGAIPVAVSEDIVALSPISFTLPAAGQSVEIVAAVTLYGDMPQLVPASVADVVLLERPVPVATERQIGTLAAADVGRLAAVRGTVTEVDPFSAGVKVTLDDTTGALVVLLWQSLYDVLPERAMLDVGAQVQVQGEVSQYRGELELVPELAEDVQVLAAAAQLAHEAVLPPTPTPRPPTSTPTETSTPTPSPTPAETPTPVVELTPIEAVTAARVGQEVTVEGTVVGTASLSSGFKFTLDDGTGQIVLLMWHEVYDDCWDAAEINLGARVRATGEVSQYEGELQIQPDFGGDVKVVAGATAQAARREIGSLSGSDEGQRVMIEGQVIRVEGLRSAVKVFVSDGTGEIVVFLWRTVLDRIPNNTALGTPGKVVRLVGLVEVYKGNLQVTPTLPNDVVVLTMP